LYGASSMGALRAAELADVGVMIGCGQIFLWYWEGVCEADDEVCLLYHRTPAGDYVSDTCPLVNIRAGLMKQVQQGIMTLEDSRAELEKQQSIHYTERATPSYSFDQKRSDAIELLSTFRDLEYHTSSRPDITWITDILNATVERERRIENSGFPITLQNIDSYINLHCLEHNQILWDSKNRALALILCDIMNIRIEEEDLEREWSTFCARHKLTNWDLFQEWLKENAISRSDFTVLCLQNARIHKLHLAFASTKNWSRQTLTILNYLRTHDRLRLWIEDCSDLERQIVNASNEEPLSIDFEIPLNKLISDHLDLTGLEITGTLDDFLRETGIGGIDELRVCLERYSLVLRKT